MSYEEMFEKAKREGALKPLNPVFIQWEKEGQDVLGRLKEKVTVTGTLGNSEYTQYIMETDAGLVKFSLGQATDKEVGSLLKIGNVYYIKYLGKEKITGGRQINRFEIKEVTVGDELADDEIPF